MTLILQKKLKKLKNNDIVVFFYDIMYSMRTIVNILGG